MSDTVEDVPHKVKVLGGPFDGQEDMRAAAPGEVWVLMYDTEASKSLPHDRLSAYRWLTGDRHHCGRVARVRAWIYDAGMTAVARGYRENGMDVDAIIIRLNALANQERKAEP